MKKTFIFSYVGFKKIVQFSSFGRIMMKKGSIETSLPVNAQIEFKNYSKSVQHTITMNRAYVSVCIARRVDYVQLGGKIANSASTSSNASVPMQM